MLCCRLFIETRDSAVYSKIRRWGVFTRSFILGATGTADDSVHMIRIFLDEVGSFFSATDALVSLNQGNIAPEFSRCLGRLLILIYFLTSNKRDYLGIFLASLDLDCVMGLVKQVTMEYAT